MAQYAQRTGFQAINYWLSTINSVSKFDDAEGEFEPNSLDSTSWEQVKEAVTQAARSLL